MVWAVLKTNFLPFYQVLLVKADVTEENDCRKIVEETMKQFGRLNILVNNAGILVLDTVENVAMENYDRIMNVNVRSAVMLTHHAVSHLIETKGCVINVSSVNGQRSVSAYEVLLTSHMVKFALFSVVVPWCDVLLYDESGCRSIHSLRCSWLGT